MFSGLLFSIHSFQQRFVKPYYSVPGSRPGCWVITVEKQISVARGFLLMRNRDSPGQAYPLLQNHFVFLQFQASSWDSDSMFQIFIPAHFTAYLFIIVSCMSSASYKECGFTYALYDTLKKLLRWSK